MHRFALCLLAAWGLWSSAAHSQSYTFTTLAGSPGSFDSTDGLGTTARFRGPMGVAVDSAGNVYVADNFNYTIRKITPDGMVSTLAGMPKAPGCIDGVGSNARLYLVHGLAVDSADNLYVAEALTSTIRKITPGGVVTTLAGAPYSRGSADGPAISARFNDPEGIAIDRAGNLYVGDTSNHTIRKITPGGMVTTLAGMAGNDGSADGLGSEARFYYPTGLAVDSAGNVYVADSWNNRIRKITPEGLVSTLAGPGGYWGAIDGTGSEAGFAGPNGVAVDSAGNLYVADTKAHTIRKITPEAVVTTLGGVAYRSGSADGPNTTARFYEPYGIALDRAGNLYVSDSMNVTIRVGRKPIVTPPALRFQIAGNRLVLSWPATVSGVVVEATSALSATAVWTPLTDPANASGGSLFLTNTLDAGARFYRLRTP